MYTNFELGRTRDVRFQRYRTTGLHHRRLLGFARWGAWRVTLSMLRLSSAEDVTKAVKFAAKYNLQFADQECEFAREN